MNDIILGIKLKADGSGLVGEVKLSRDELGKLVNETRSAAEESKKAAAANRGLGESLQDLAAKLGVAGAAWKAWSSVKEMAMLNARHEELGVVMRVVGNNAGYTSTQMAQYASQVQSMGITMLESRNTVVQLAQAQIDLSNASQLARVAQDVAVIGMTNSSDALQRMIHGIKSGEVEILRTLGINVNFEKSYKRMADQLHISTDALSDHQKMQARENAVMEEGVKVAGAYEASMGTAAKQTRSMARYVEDLKVIRGEVFNEALTVSVMAFTEQLKDANKEVVELSKNGKLKQWGEDLSGALAFLADSVMGVVGAFRLAGVGLAEFAAVSSMSLVDILRGKAAEISKAADEDRTAIIASMTTFRDALAKRRTAQKDDADKRIAIEQDYLSRAAAVQKAYAGYSVEIQQAAQRALAESTGMEYSGKFEAPASPAGKGKSGKLTEYERLTKAIQEKIAVAQLDQQQEEALTEGQRQAAQIMTDLRDGTLKLNEAQKIRLTASLELLIGIEQTNAAEKDWAKQKKVLQDATEKETDALKKQIEQAQDHVAGIGLTKEAQQLLAASKLDVAAAAREEYAANLENAAAYAGPFRDAYIEAAAAARDQAKALRELAALKREGGIKEAVADSAKKTEEEFKRTSESIERMLTDSLMRGFERGEDGAKNLRQTLWNMFRTLVLQPLLKPLVEPMARTMSGIGQALSDALLRSMGGRGTGLDFSGTPSGALDFFVADGLHSGGIAGDRPTFTRQVPASLFAAAPRLHAGGIAGDEVPAILRRGEGVFTTEQMARMGGVTNNIDIVVNTDGGGRVQGDTTNASELGRRIDSAVRGVLLKEMQPGGLLAGA